METIDYEDMRPDEAQVVCDLVERVFKELVAPNYEPEGVEEFFRFANATAMADRVRSGGFVLVAKRSGKLVGALEFAPPDRIAMLFVTHRGQGIGRDLLARAIERARCITPSLSKVTVHASPNAETAYQKMGFQPSGKATTERGIRYLPMELRLSQ